VSCRLRTRRDCCRYHRVDWHAVSAAAIRIALQAQASGTPPEEAAGAITPASCGLDGDDLEALGDLLMPEIGIQVDDDDPYDQHVYEGRHRVTAMRDARVRRTVILRPGTDRSGGRLKLSGIRGCRYRPVMPSVVFAQDGPGRPNGPMPVIQLRGMCG
jgi:hypothetical protein